MVFRIANRHLGCWLLGCIFIAAGSTGCNRHEWPETYPTKGKVVFKDGTPLKSGLITFSLVTDPETRSVGSIQSDGTFELNTIAMAENADSKMFSGRAVAGEYFVNIYPYPGTAGGGRGSYTLKTKYTIDPGDANQITVLMEPVVK